MLRNLLWHKDPGKRRDPYIANNFLVEIDGIAIASFTDVSGLSIDTEVERKRFGGENDKEYAFITQSKYGDITLKHGTTDQEYLWKWYSNIIKGKIMRRDGSIYLLDNRGNAVVWWDFFNAFPIKWEGPAFSASGNSVAIETLVLTHQGLQRHK